MAPAWFPLHVHSHYSLLDGLSKADKIAARVKECGFAGSALTDHGSISGVVPFLKAMKAAGKKPILGNEFYVCPQDAAIRDKTNDERSHLCVLAKNLQGWRNLIQATSASNRPEFFYRKPRLNLERLADFSKGDFVVFSGHMGSDMANVIFGENYRQAYNAETYDQAKSFARDAWHKHAIAMAGRYQEMFGKGNFKLEINLVDAVNLPAAQVIADGLRYVSKKTGIPCIGTPDAHYPRQEDAQDQRILLCSAFDTTLNKVKQRMLNEEEVGLAGFFRSNRYHIPSLDEMVAIHTPEELAETLVVADMCEVYDILNAPMLPAFDCPNGLNADAYLKQLCINGWNRRIEGKVSPGRLSEYKERVKKELGVLLKAGLAAYFLVVHDYCNFARSNGWRVGKGRGSGAGCLVSYLLGITNVDPIEYGLLFERFYNDGRNAPGRIAFPDIDTDFEVKRREQIIEYIRNKYGHERVAQMVTFGRMQGRQALKDVLKAHERCSLDEMHRITEFVPDEAAISDELQEMKEAGEDPSIIGWALDNNADQLKEWCVMKPDGTLEGPYAKEFAQAIRLEGTKRSQSKHASGLIISTGDLSKVCPMLYDKSTQQMVVGVEMADAEAMGQVKFDILGTTVLDKISDAMSVISTGKVVAA